LELHLEGGEGAVVLPEDDVVSAVGWQRGLDMGVGRAAEVVIFGDDLELGVGEPGVGVTVGGGDVDDDLVTGCAGEGEGAVLGRLGVLDRIGRLTINQRTDY
jgi:hypothetical protein